MLNVLFNFFYLKYFVGFIFVIVNTRIIGGLFSIGQSNHLPKNKPNLGDSVIICSAC